jgi:predicted nuclease with TOPRIM domain
MTYEAEENYYIEENSILMTENLRLESEVEELKKEIRELKDLNNKYYEKIRAPIYDPFTDTCSHCDKNIEQYNLMKSAFDRRKQQHQAIAEFFKHDHFTHNGQRMSLTKLIKYGLDLQKQK